LAAKIPKMNHSGPIDFKLLFESAQGLYLVLFPDLTIVAVSNAYLKATMTEREKIVGKNLFEVFPDNPNDPVAKGETNLRFSLNYVLDHKTTHTMAVQKYDIRDASGKFEERYWSPVNKPIFGDDGEIRYIIHRVEDVTDFIRLSNQRSTPAAHTVDQEVYKRAQEIQEINSKLLNEMNERKTAELKLKEASILLQACLESHRDVLIFSIDKHYRYLNFNVAFKTGTFHAYGRNVVQGMNLGDSITVDEDFERIKANCDRAFAGENHVTIEEYGDAQRYYYETRYNPITNDKKEVIGATVLSANITERIMAERQIQTLNKELEAFTYSVAHDLRAPLRVIDGYSGLLTEDYAELLGKDGKRLIDIIALNARQMGQLIDDLLQFARLGRLSVKKQRVDVNGMMNQLINEQLRQIPKDRIDIRVSPLDAADCDGSLIRHVLSNLISNAIKYSGKRERAIIEVGSTKSETEIVYFVKDNGSGFDMKYADKLFGVFQRLHKASDYEGTGVGLAIVHRVVIKHGGRVWAESEPDRGATFYFSLPVHDN
jgi:PAS domain S-box-containing protein